MMVKKKQFVLWVLGLLIGLTGSEAMAADHTNLEEGLPVELEDALPTAYHNREFQQQSRFQLNDNGKTEYTLSQRLEYGIVRNGQISLEVPVQLGNAVKNDLGDLRLRALYNFNAETPLRPALAIAGGMDMPTAPGSSGVDTELKGIVTKTVPYTSKLIKVHFNGSWLHNAKPKDFQRNDRYKLVMGSSFRISPSIIGIVDYVKEQTLIKGKTYDILEAGIRQMITPLTLIGLGVGMGVSNDSPKFRVTLSLQHSF